MSDDFDYFEEFRKNDDGESLDLSSTGWSPNRAFENVVEERLMNHLDNKGVTNKLIDENAPVAVQSIVHLAMSAKSERVRLDASRYLVDRVLGKIPEAASNSDTANPLEVLLSQVADYANDSSNS